MSVFREHASLPAMRRPAPLYPADPPPGLALSIKRSFDGGDKEFQVNFVLTCYLRYHSQPDAAMTL